MARVKEKYSRRRAEKRFAHIYETVAGDIDIVSWSIGLHIPEFLMRPKILQGPNEKMELHESDEKYG